MAEEVVVLVVVDQRRFKVNGYPTMILFRPDGTEVTRLPGEADLERYMQALPLGMTAAHPVR